jgi:GTPase SAR1 family protein
MGAALCPGDGDNGKRDKRTMKVAIIGTAASGKTTFFKQMQILHRNGFDTTENQNFLRILRSNFYTGLKELVNSVETAGNKVSKQNKKNAKFFLEFTNIEDQISEEIIQQANELWADEAIQQVWEKRDSLPNFTIVNFDYIIKNIERLAGNDAIATNDDIVRCRQRTTGLSELDFPYGKNYFHLFDVGGQKPERKKWDIIAETHKPTAIIYFASLIDFDVPLLTEEGKSRMDESLEVWEECLNKEGFKNTTVILMLNKLDLFEDKIERVDMTQTYKKYKGGNDYDKAKAFILKMFEKKSLKTLHTEQKVYSHFTCAIDTNVMEKVFESITEQILRDRIGIVINI